ncbi:hypothetical protein BU062_06580 [Staphylococcus succinus]|uniref:hypothetical protein n=1 Tax=Staphylococcus succinus TaxID=61015 RepID=UPI000D1DFF99|nr:hypothetical protein [Staphylococcus succinus]PTI42066.1 hypothetical protein BU062_06580 [Staphylococcus succinus]
MNRAKLRLVFNILLAIIFFCYISLIWIIDINALGSVIYSVLFFGVLIVRDVIAPKKYNDTDKK